MIRGGYIVICENISKVRAPYVSQKSYDFWMNEFYNKSLISNDLKTLNKAIPILINRIENDTNMLKQIPYNNHRIFEEIIAENVYFQDTVTIELLRDPKVLSHLYGTLP